MALSITSRNSTSIPFRDLVANYVGKAWVAVLNIMAVPLYIKFMGIEAFGLVGFFLSLQSVLVLLDMGLSTTLNRELARCTALPGQQQRMHDVVKTLGILYWSLAVIAGLAVVGLAPLVATKWVHSTNIAPSIVVDSLRLFGISVVFQAPVSLYTGGLMGIQRQVWYNAANALMWTIRVGGTLLTLRYICNSLIVYCGCQVIFSVIYVALLSYILHHSLPKSSAPATFRLDMLPNLARYSSGIGLSSGIILVFNQVDKLILSKLVDLHNFGYYTLAWQLAGVLFILYTPIYAAFFPVLSRKVATQDLAGLASAYLLACQIMAVTVIPVGMVMVFFSYDILLAWTGNSLTAMHTYALVSALLPGAISGALMYMPFALQTAHTVTRDAIKAMSIALVGLILLLLVVAPRFHCLGSALTWSIINIGLSALIIRQTYTWLPRMHYNRWFLDALSKPLFISVSVCIAFRIVVIHDGHRLLHAGLPCVALLVALVATARATPDVWILVSRAIASARNKSYAA